MTFVTRDRLLLGAGVTTAALLTAAAVVSSTAAAHAATVGDPAPAFSEHDSTGRLVSLEEFRGKTVVLEWTNDGCPYVRNQYATGNMQKTQAAAVKDGVVWISVISSRPGAQGYVTGKRADELTASRGAHPTHVLLDADGSMGHAYGAKSTPDMFVITPDGKIAYSGAIDSIETTNPAETAKATNYVVAALHALKAGGKPDPALTRSYGCGVKY
ncbi:MAG: redoxin family protein [Alphaproteobacteria bacterium]|nr:redoxin family protein [Alphaproteobacteria bacterium]